MDRRWIGNVLSGVLLLLVLGLCSGDLEPVLQRCCLTGESLARNHTTCAPPPQATGNVLPRDRLTCLTSVYLCCIRAHRRINCNLGKEAAKEGKPCGLIDNVFTDCCTGCSLGLQAGTMRNPCTFLHFSFGSPWDDAFIDCCEEINSESGTSPQTGRVVCEPNSPCTQKCDVIENKIKCSCYAGFQLAADQASCEDVNECDTGSHTCHPIVEYCINKHGGFECAFQPVQDPMPSQCPTGYSMNPQTRLCDDIDECLEDPCPVDKVCVNVKGSYTCTDRNSNCPSGFVYSENTGTCIDVDECQQNLHICNSSQICQNSHGSYQCISMPTRYTECPAGFKWLEDSRRCEDFDECQEDLHGCDVDRNCRNTIGGYECDPKCFLLMKFDPVQNKCVDSNPCVDNLHNCKDNEVCIPTDEGGLDFMCIPKSGNNQCPPGYKPSASNSQACEDIDECEEFPDVCDLEREICVNDKGNYDCIPNEEQKKDCPSGFKMDDIRRYCVDVDECLENLHDCDKSTQDCVNYNGTYQCVPKASAPRRCPPGFIVNPRTNGCEDVNECTEGRQLCLPEEECVNVPGAYRCQPISLTPTCPPGHRFNASVNSCTDVNECLENSHSCNRITQRCVNDIGSYRCVSKSSCPHGYRLAGNKCDDVNECLEGTDDCDRDYQNCVNTVGSYQCQSKDSARHTRCGSGYTFDAALDACRDLNECELTQPCFENQICQNTDGSYHCSCLHGYTLDAFSKECKDINECQLGLYSCESSQRCDNTPGSYSCIRMTSCGTGYTLNAATNQCEDDDECILNTHNCGPGFSCRNIQGSFRCDRVTCPPGQKLLADGTCKGVNCGRGFELDAVGHCIDINECAREYTCRTNQRCINTVGSYRCQNLLNCPPGYELNEFGNQCVDVDECARRLYDCGAQQTCRNRAGGYVCDCPRGYSLNIHMQCEDIDECTRFRGQICSSVSDCINTQGSYVCNCKEGFRKAEDDKNCDDIDECAESENICQQVCNNVWGSYQCSCNPGFTLGPDSRTCQDIDECKTYEGHGDLCIGYCVNEPGSFSCSCPPGYRLSSDKRTCQDIDECQEQNVCNGDREVCLNMKGSFKCNRIACPPNYVRDKDHRNRCKKAASECNFDDVVCLNEPKSLSYNYITFVSNIRIPFSGQLDLFTMRGPRLTVTTVQFNLEFKHARARAGIPAATREYFHLRRTAYNEAMVSLTKSIQGPQEIELDLVLKMFHNGKFAGNAIAKLFIFVTEHKF